MMMGRIKAPSPEQLAAINDYLQEHSQKEIPTGRADDLQQTEGGRLFGSVCSRCHALPYPGQHTAREWPSVMERMRRYISEADQDQPPEKDWEQIVNFLKRNSGVEDTAEEGR